MATSTKVQSPERGDPGISPDPLVGLSRVGVSVRLAG
jgi:hypothetical protein